MKNSTRIARQYKKSLIYYLHDKSEINSDCRLPPASTVCCIHIRMYKNIIVATAVVVVVVVVVVIVIVVVVEEVIIIQFYAYIHIYLRRRIQKQTDIKTYMCVIYYSKGKHVVYCFFFLCGI
jgi:hypothetical protein